MKTDTVAPAPAYRIAMFRRYAEGVRVWDSAGRTLWLAGKEYNPTPLMMGVCIQTYAGPVDLLCSRKLADSAMEDLAGTWWAYTVRTGLVTPEQRTAAALWRAKPTVKFQAKTVRRGMEAIALWMKAGAGVPLSACCAQVGISQGVLSRFVEGCAEARAAMDQALQVRAESKGFRRVQKAVRRDLAVMMADAAR